VAILKNAPHPAAAKRLADYLLSAYAEERLARSDSRNTPIREKLASEFAEPFPFSGVGVADLIAVHRAIPDAMRICTEILGE
jgi:ABC-type Fe3+ transport system substrate-binding protein